MKQDGRLIRAGHEDVVWLGEIHLDFVVGEVPKPCEFSTSVNRGAWSILANCLCRKRHLRMICSIETLESLVDRRQLLGNAEFGLLRVDRPVDGTADNDREVDCD